MEYFNYKATPIRGYLFILSNYLEYNAHGKDMKK